MAPRPVSVLHLITGLGCGGAENALARLVASVDEGAFPQRVVCLMPEGPLGERIRTAGVPLHSLNMTSPAHLPRAVRDFRALVRRHAPDVVQSWLYHADLVAALALWGMKRPALVWSLRCSDMDMRHYALTSRLVRRACALLSHRPAAIVANSHAGADSHRALGYGPRRSLVISNGFDLEQFRPDSDAPARLRAELDLPADSFVVGMVARRDPQKDHATFVAAAALLAAQCPQARFVLAGDGLEPGAPEIAALLARHPGLDQRFRLLGRRSPIAPVVAGLDVASLSSAFGEGFPNVLGEAMACGVPCVATDVGDSRWLMDHTGLCVPPGDPAALAEGWLKMWQMGAEARAQLGAKARTRIAAQFSQQATDHHYQELWRDVGSL